ncbi:hypothetical protein ES703_118964 [subsurface metagenome]
MIAADADGVPVREELRPELKGVHNEAHRRLWWEDVLILGDIFFKDVVLDSTSQPLHRDAPLLSGSDVHGPDHACGAVYGHRCGYLVQGDAIKKHLHIGEGGDRHATLAKLPHGLWGIGVVSHEGGHIEGNTEPCFPMLQEVLEAGVGLLCGTKAGEHAHRPQPPAIPVVVNATHKGVFAREAYIRQVVHPGDIL